VGVVRPKYAAFSGYSKAFTFFALGVIFEIAVFKKNLAQQKADSAHFLGARTAAHVPWLQTHR